MFAKMQNPIFSIVLAGLTLFATGCASVDFLKFKKEEFPEADAKNPVSQILSMWQPTHGVGMDGKSCRGFAGQILFLTRDNPTPAKVNGTVRIYVFDDQGKPEEQAKPIHQFDFPGDAWNVQARISKLGLTYSIFIPYTRPGTHEAHCSLKVRFIPKEGQGQTVYSEMCNVDLPGVAKKKKEVESENDPDLDDEYVRKAMKAAKETGRGRIEQASYEEPADGRGDRRAIEQLAAEAFGNSQSRKGTAPRTLPPEEEQRILREMQSQMGGSTSTNDAGPNPKSSTVRRKGRNPLDRVELARNDEDDDEEGEDAPVYRRTANRPVSRWSHLLDDNREMNARDSDGTDDDFAPPVTRKSNKVGGSVKKPRHPLDMENAPETTRRSRKGREPLTIDLSELQ